MTCEHSVDPSPPKEALRSELQDAIRACTDGEASLLARSRLWWDVARHRDDICGDPWHLCLPCGVCLGFWPCSKNPEFSFGSYGADTGLLPVSALVDSANAAISHKTERVLQVVPDSGTCQWWLALVDYVGLPIHLERDFDEFRRGISIPDVWSRVIFFDLVKRSHELFPCPRPSDGVA